MPKRTKKVKAEATVLLGSPISPVWSLPRTAADYDAMVEQMAVGAGSYNGPLGFDGMMQSALRAIGITRPKA